jgi:hypothetical protein
LAVDTMRRLFAAGNRRWGRQTDQAHDPKKSRREPTH